MNRLFVFRQLTLDEGDFSAPRFNTWAAHYRDLIQHDGCVFDEARVGIRLISRQSNNSRAMSLQHRAIIVVLTDCELEIYRLTLDKRELASSDQRRHGMDNSFEHGSISAVGLAIRYSLSRPTERHRDSCGRSTRRTGMATRLPWRTTST